MKIKRSGNYLAAVVLMLAAAGCSDVDPETPPQPTVTSEAVAAPIQLPQPESTGAKLVSQYCGECHAPPRPSMYKANEWPGVVARMQNYRTIRGHGAVSEPELKRLLEYLQQHSAKAPV